MSVFGQISAIPQHGQTMLYGRGQTMVSRTPASGMSASISTSPPIVSAAERDGGICAVASHAVTIVLAHHANANAYTGGVSLSGRPSWRVARA